jgi:hypothetical protein
MITFFTIPKAITGHSAIIQTNAIKSWMSIEGCKVILFGDDPGVKELADELHITHYPGIQRNEFNTPLVSDAFKIASRIAATPYIAYVNSDIIFTGSILDAVKMLDRSPKKKWVMVGQRTNLDITTLLTFSTGWQSRLEQDTSERGILHGKAGIDYFLFPKDLQLVMPDFAVGRPGWDSWLIYYIRSNKIPLIDAGAAILAIHQNHPPAYKHYGAEAQKNKTNAGGYYKMGTIRDADWKLEKQNGLSRNWPGILFFLSGVRAILSVKRSFKEKRTTSK